MSSERRKLSSRLNGARSRSPVTSEGKRRSSTNPLRHGLLATHTVILQDHLQGLGPLDGAQLGLIEDMTSGRRRMRRLRAFENAAMKRPIRGASPDADSLSRMLDAYPTLADSRKSNNLNLYEGRLHCRNFRAPNPNPNKMETNEPS